MKCDAAQIVSFLLITDANYDIAKRNRGALQQQAFNREGALSENLCPISPKEGDKYGAAEVVGIRES